MKRLEVKHVYGESELTSIILQLLYYKLETYDFYYDSKAHEKYVDFINQDHGDGIDEFFTKGEGVE